MTNEQYENERNKFIPAAKKYADGEAGPKPKGSKEQIGVWNDKWNKLFHSQMNILSRQSGLVS